MHTLPSLTVIYDLYASQILGLITRIIPDHTLHEKIFLEVFSYISRNSGDLNCRRYSLFNWVMNTTRIIAVSHSTGEQKQAECSQSEIVAYFKLAVYNMYNEHRMPKNEIAERLLIPVKLVDRIVKT